MRSAFFVAVVLLVPAFIFGQDAYHSELVDYLGSEFNVEVESYRLADNDQENIDDSYFYGNGNRNIVDVAGFTFTKSHQVQVQQGDNPWDAGIGNRNKTSLSEDDIVLASFWGKSNSASSELFVFAEDVISYDKEFYYPLQLSGDWTQYFIAFRSSKAFNVNRLAYSTYPRPSLPQITEGVLPMHLGEHWPMRALKISVKPISRFRCATKMESQ